jgi:glycosyltransferase involved in cell wall biosynthesis
MTSYSYSGRYWQDIAINFYNRTEKLAFASLASFPMPDWSIENKHITYLQARSNHNFLFEFIKLWGAVRALKPDVIQTHLFRAGLVGLLFGKLFNIPVVVTRHHIDEHFQAGSIMHRLLDRITVHLADAVIVRSLAAKNWLVDVEKANIRKIFVVNQGFDFDLLKPTKQEIQLCKTELGIAGSNFNILCVARYSRTKGQEYLVEAVSMLLSELPNLRLIFIGPGDSAWLKELIVLRKIDHITKILSTRQDIPACLASADIVVHPSLVDSFSQLLIEAQAVGSVVIATDIAAAREQVDDGESGIIVNPKNPHEIAQAISRLYLDSSLRERMGINGSARVQQKYQVETMVDQDLHVLKAVLPK